jgi:cellulose synthase/poly-beta-1,6-N-acetylglucosamine synthase-like glycosyltransferase
MSSYLPVILCALAAADVLLAAGLFTLKVVKARRGMRRAVMRDTIVRAVSAADNEENFDFRSLGFHPGVLFSVYRDLSVSIVLPDGLTGQFVDYFGRTGVTGALCRKTRSVFSSRRAAAVSDLAFLPCSEARRALESALVAERKYFVKVCIVSALIDTEDYASIPYILQTLIGAPGWYNDKIYAMMGGFGARLHDYLVGLGDVQSKEINMIIASFGKFYFSPSMKTILSKLALSGDDDVSRAASDACRALYPEVLVSAEFFSSGNIHVRRNAIRAAAAFPSKESVSIVLDLMADGSVRDDCAAALSEMASKDSHLLQDVIFRFVLEQDPTLKVSMAEILSERIEYLLARMRHDGSEQMKSLIADIAGRGGLSGLIGFLNGNTDRDLEERICGAIAGLVESRYDINSEFRLYLDERILPRFGLTRLEPMKGSSRKEAVRTDLLALFIALAVLPFPIAFLAGFHGSFPAMGLSLSVKTYLSFFTYLFAFYGIAINSIYLLLLLFSIIGADRQIRRWRDKNLRFLFKPGILPSISIIAPAYGEEATIVESVTSLLNLHYPDFEVIVVNDGSPDGTLQRLIGRFGLERVDRRIKERLKTAPVRGIYRNRHIPNLTVVDKVNGGKADSLNAGINIASKDYFCGIDADSLLESDSLLKMTSPFLDTDEEIIATGGNILPVNGCSVDRGELTRIGIPEKFLPRLQTMEYIRSFIAGRVGWATIRCLVIISGAFGLFRKESVVESGGYLTGRERFRKDTVGEDMELVVRLIRHSSLGGKRGRINYVFNANCWTEVPESYGILRRQRDRWQRGLLDIMTFHIGILFNPRYREVGLVAFPYFILFEVIGPWIEFQGLAVFALSLALGLLTVPVVILLLIGTIFMGIAVSIVSFYILGRGTDYFTKRDFRILIFYAFLENFGIRQFLSVSRLGGYINALRNKQGWGRMVRRGFQRPD